MSLRLRYRHVFRTILGDHRAAAIHHVPLGAVTQSDYRRAPPQPQRYPGLHALELFSLLLLPGLQAASYALSIPDLLASRRAECGLSARDQIEDASSST